MTPLERRYRRVLRALPASYREMWEEEMTATFLETVRTGDADRDEYLALWGRPRPAEIASVAALAVRLRLGGSEAPARSFVWGEAVRLIALIGLLFAAVAATMGTVQEVWLAGWLPWPPVPEALDQLTSTSLQPGLPEVIASAAPLLWVGAFLALVLGRRRAAMILALAALAPAAVMALGSTAQALSARTAVPSLVLSTWSNLVMSGLPVLALAGFHREAPRVRTRPWLRAYLVGVALAPITGVLLLAQPLWGVLLLDWPGICSIALVVAGAAHLARRARPGMRGAAAWSLGLALLAAVTLGGRALTLLTYALAPGAGSTALTMAVGVLQGVGVVVVGVALAADASRRLHGLPASGREPVGGRPT